MLITNWNNKLLSYAMVLVGLITLVSLDVNSAAIFAQNNSEFVRQRQAMVADETGLSNPAGLAFSTDSNPVPKRCLPGCVRGKSRPNKSTACLMTNSGSNKRCTKSGS